MRIHPSGTQDEEVSNSTSFPNATEWLMQLPGAPVTPEICAGIDAQGFKTPAGLRSLVMDDLVELGATKGAARTVLQHIREELHVESYAANGEDGEGLSWLSDSLPAKISPDPGPDATSKPKIHRLDLTTTWVQV